LSSIQKLAGQTIWYGIPTIVARFLGFILQLFFTSIYQPDVFGIITQIYAAIPFLNILFTYGLETSYFRFVQQTDKNQLYNTLCSSMLVSTLVFTGIIMAMAGPISSFLELGPHPEYILITAWILCFDTLATLPFARLRQEGRPRKYALIKVATIVTQIVVTLLLIQILPAYADASWMRWYQPEHGVRYILIANLAASVVGLVLLYSEVQAFRFQFDKALFKNIMRYSLPLVIVGFGGMINEMLSRLMFTKISPLPTFEKNTALGIFGANYKLAVLITIFIQAFRMGAEPFFFNQSRQEDAPLTYARVMKFFTITCAGVFLVVSLFLDLWAVLISQKTDVYLEGLEIVPILTMGSVFLGIYYNLSIWYKLTNRNMIGAYITIVGAALTILLNYWWIPEFSYVGASWATFCCYAFMMVVSYILGQRYYPIPYPIGRLLLYLGLAALIYVVHAFCRTQLDSQWWIHVLGVVGLLLYGMLIGILERKEIRPLWNAVKQKIGA
jgi:O-antigen/teichoic acid export membrane protein